MGTAAQAARQTHSRHQQSALASQAGCWTQPAHAAAAAGFVGHRLVEVLQLLQAVNPVLVKLIPLLIEPSWLQGPLLVGGLLLDLVHAVHAGCCQVRERRLWRFLYRSVLLVCLVLRGRTPGSALTCDAHMMHIHS